MSSDELGAPPEAAATPDAVEAPASPAPAPAGPTPLRRPMLGHPPGPQLAPPPADPRQLVAAHPPQASESKP